MRRTEDGMKKLILILAAAAAAAALLGAILPPYVSAGQEQGADAPRISEEYIVAQYDGAVAVFSGGELLMRTDTPVASLPKADRTRLEKGISVYSQKELKALLEDLCS